MKHYIVFRSFVYSMGPFALSHYLYVRFNGNEEHCKQEAVKYLLNKGYMVNAPSFICFCSKEDAEIDKRRKYFV